MTEDATNRIMQSNNACANECARDILRVHAFWSLFGLMQAQSFIGLFILSAVVGAQFARLLVLDFGKHNQIG